MAEYAAANRGLSKAHLQALQIERDQRYSEKSFKGLLDSIRSRVDTLELRSPTQLSANDFWDEYFKTDRQRKAEKAEKARQALSAISLTEARLMKRNKKLAPAATKVVTKSASSLDFSEDDSDDEESSDSSEKNCKSKKPPVPASSAPPGDRLARQKSALVNKPSTAVGLKKGPYSFFDAEFDDNSRRRLRENAMTMVDETRSESAPKSHPFIKKMLLTKMEAPANAEDANTLAMQKKEEKLKQKRLKRAGKNRTEEQTESSTKQPNKANSKTAKHPTISQAKAKMKEAEDSELLNPIFLDERKGQELYRILVQQEIKWTRQAVVEASRRNRLASKREYSFFLMK